MYYNLVLDSEWSRAVQLMIANGISEKPDRLLQMAISHKTMRVTDEVNLWFVTVHYMRTTNEVRILIAHCDGGIYHRISPLTELRQNINDAVVIFDRVIKNSPLHPILEY